MALNDVLSQFKDVFDRLSLIQKISIIGATLAVSIAIIVLVVWANRPAYRTLYADLNQEDAAEIIEALQGRNVPYKLEEGGGTVTIPQEMVYETRLQLAAEGIPRGGGAGFELFDKSSYGMTEFLQNVNYQRALQGELSRTIGALDEIREARVHLTIPKDRLFISEESAAKAAVVLRLYDDAQLTKQKVQAIAQLVAGAVKGLSPQNVQIVDTDGRLLSESLDENVVAMEMSQAQLQYQRRVESTLEAKVNSILDRTYGEGNAVARVTAEIDFAKRTSTIESFDPNPVLRSQQSLEIESRNGPRAPQGIPGVEPNLAEPDITATGMESEYTKAEETQNFEVGKTVTHEEKAYGVIKRITVAVVVDDRKEIVEEDGRRDVVNRPRTEEELASLRNIVTMAAGINPERGDEVEVNNISFDTRQEDTDLLLLERERMVEMYSIIAKYATAIILLVMFYFLIIRPIVKRIERSHELEGPMFAEGDGGMPMDLGPEISTQFPKTVEELEKEIEGELASNVPVDVESVKSKVMLKKIEETANEDPEMIANLIRALLKGGGN